MKELLLDFWTLLVLQGLAVSLWNLGSVSFHSVTIDIWFQEALLCDNGGLLVPCTHSVTVVSFLLCHPAANPTARAQCLGRRRRGDIWSDGFCLPRAQ